MPIQEQELKLLGKKNFLIVSAGANDMDNSSSTVSEIIVPLIHFIKKHEHTNIITVNMPLRYDLEKDTCLNNINRNIHRCNVKLNKLLKLHPYASLVETTTDRRHFTKHELHLNNSGKELIVKQIFKQIRLVMMVTNKSETPLPLQWGKDQLGGEMGTIKKNTPAVTPEASLQGRKDQLGGETGTIEETTPAVTLEASRRISSRNKKTPKTRTQDILWETMM